MTTLILENVAVRYGKRIAVAGVNWNIGTGFHALLGPNGAGKTSLLRAIATLQRRRSGTILLDGRSVDENRYRLGFLPQGNLGKSRFTVQEHLAYMCWLREIPAIRATQEVDRVLELVQLTQRRGDKISSLSGGMRRRVGIGSALVGEPSLVVLDEPSAGLDVAQRDSLTQVLHEVSRQAIVIVSTHIVEDVLDHADTLAVMDQGQFKWAGFYKDFAPLGLADLRNRYLSLVTT